MENHYAIQVQGLQNIVLRGLSLNFRLQPTATLLACAVAFFALAVRR